MKECQTNYLVAIITTGMLLAFTSYRLLLGDPPFAALYGGLGAALAVFLCWSLGREIDPANDWSAFVGMPFCLVGVIFYGAPGLAALFFVLLLSRMLNRSTGLQARLADSVFLMVLGVVVFSDGSPAAPFLLTLSFGLDAVIKPRHNRQIWFFLAGLPYCAVLFFLLSPALQPRAFGLPQLIIITLLCFMVLLVISRTRCDRVPDDEQGFLLSNTRIHLAQILVAVFLAGELLWPAAGVGLARYYPALAAYGGVAAYHLLKAVTIQTFLRHKRTEGNTADREL